MTKYVDVEKVLQIVQKYSLDKGVALGKHSGVADIIADEIENLPTIDIVTCKECVYGENGPVGYFCWYHDGVESADDFCCQAERCVINDEKNKLEG